MLVKIGRNEPCPCGSGKKLKKCCGGAAAADTFTRGDRERALERLERFASDDMADEDDEAFDEFWGERLERPDELSPELDEQSTAVFDSWSFFDRPLSDGRSIAEVVLAEAAGIGAGERLFLKTLCASAMHLWEVEDVAPGISLTLRDVLENRTVVVQEKSGSRAIGRHELLAARVIERGASGRPEMERGLLRIPRLFYDSVRKQLTSERASFLRENPVEDLVVFYKALPPYFHDVWVGAILDPSVPNLHNTDGDPLLITHVTYEVLEREAVVRALDASEGLEPEQQGSGADHARWSWDGDNPEGERVSLGTLTLIGEILVLETNSAPRGERGRKLLESLAGGVLRYRSTTHEDLTQRVKEAVRERALGRGVESEPPPEAIPPEAADALVLDHMARHYRAWLDDSIPALDGKSPREAAKTAKLRGKLVELLHDLESTYERALKTGEPAYDASWMWAELELRDESENRSPPALAHERLADLMPGSAELSRTIAEAERKKPGFQESTTTFSIEQCRENLEARRFLQLRGLPANDASITASETGGRLQALTLMVNFDLHRRKAFWVDEALSFLLARTDIEAVGGELRVPFPSFALVYTDRHVLSLGERLLSRRADDPNSGHILKVATVYVVETEAAETRKLELTFALDAGGADAPTLLRYELRLRSDEGVTQGIDALSPRPPLVDPPVADVSPLRGLLTVTLNSILYATSPGVEPELRAAQRSRGRREGSSAKVTFTSDDVFFLPGKIEISTLRAYQALERLPAGRTILHRSMVRGHWRRAGKNWTDQSLRWIAPYWKGPELAAVIERAYRLTR